MNLYKKAFALFIFAGLTAGQAQAAKIEFSTDEVVGAILKKVTALLEKEDLARIVAGLGLTGLCIAASNKIHNEAKKCYDDFNEFLGKFLAADVAMIAGIFGARTIEIIYNA